MKVALVTGGSRGIGRAIADRLGQDGYRVVTLSRSPPIVDITPEFTRYENSENWIRCDALEQSDVNAAADRVAKSDVSVLVNNVGGGGRWGSSLFVGTDAKVYEQVYAKNAVAMVKFTQACVPFMVDSGWGRVVTIASIYGKEAGGRPAFNMAKSAEISFMKSLSRDPDLVGRNVTFNTVCPGHISVPGKPDDGPVGPMGRMGRPEEVAAVVAFLCREEASFVNGACITVDGGESWSF